MFIAYPPATVNIQPSFIKKRKHPAVTKIAEITPHPGKDSLGRTSLHIAALKHDRRWLRALSAAREEEALIQADIFGMSPLHYAAQREMLSEMLAGRINLKALLEVQNEDGNTPLHIMAEAQNFDRSFVARLRHGDLEELLKIKNNRGETVIDLCRRHKDKGLAQNLLNVLPQNSSLRGTHIAPK